MAWNSRKRVAAAIHHREADRVPLSLTITQPPYEALRRALGLPEDENIKANAFTEVQPHLDLLRSLGVDITFVKLRRPHYWRPPPPLDDGSWVDEWGVGRKPIEIQPGVVLNEVSHSPLAHAELKDLANYPWPKAADPGRVEGLREEARSLFETTDLAIMGRFGGTILEQAAYLRGWEQWLIDLASDPEFARRLLDIITDIQIQLDEMGIQAAGKYLSIFKLSGEDFGMQDRPLFSMRTWHELILPPLRRRWSAARQALDAHAPHVKLMLHSDGAIRPFLPDLIECGIDILDPVQHHCQGMDLYDLKRDFGDQLVFHGAVDTQEVLPHGSPEEVVLETKRCLDALGRGGGYLLAPVHNVQTDVPPANIIAMCEAVKEFGCYPLPQQPPLPIVRVPQRHLG